MKSRYAIAMLVAVLGSLAQAESPRGDVRPLIAYQIPRAGQVSLAVYDQQGCQIRTLLAGEPQAAGTHTVGWDGLDRLGNPMPVGDYTWKLLMNQGLEADYVSVIGQNVIDPAQPWVPTVGSHQGPSSVLLGDGGALYHGSRNSEEPPVVMKLGSEKGPVLWVRNWQSKGPIDMAEIGKSLCILSWDNYVQKVDAQTGADQGPPRDVLWPGDVRAGIDDPVRSYATRITADGDNLVLIYRNHNTLRWINPATGAAIRDVTIDKPQDVATGADGTIYVVSGNAVVAVAGDGKIRTVVDEGTLVAPVAIDYDRVNKQILVANGGADQRVLRFSLDGKQVATYGRQGGRLDGAYEPKDFKDVSHLTCDNSGGFYAVESDHVRRIVHIAANGDAARQWFGGAPFFAVASADAAAPRQVWYSASYTTMAVADLDLDTGAWTITQTYSMPEKGLADGLFPEVTRFPVWRVRHRGGIKYLIHESPAAVLRVDEVGRKLVPVALASHKSWDAKAYPGKAINAAMAKQGLTYDDPGSDAFTWSDTNGNGELDPDEFRFHDVAAPINNGRYCAFDDNLNVYIGYYEANNYTYTGNRWLLFDFQGSAYVKLPNLASAGSVTPVWDWSRLERARAKVPADIRVGAAAVRWDARGGVTLALRGGIEDRHGLTWPDGQVECAHLLRALPDGTAWTVSKHDSPGMPPATVLRHPGYFPATTHGCIIACDRNYYGATAWTEDGLYAGFFLDRHADDLPAWAYHPYGRGLHGLFGGDDWECAGSVTDLADGSVLWMPRNSGRSAVFRVRGWDNWFRDSGNVSLTQPPAAATPDGNGLTAAYFRNKFSGQSVASRADARLWFQNGPASQRVKSWAAGPCPGISAHDAFSVRWTGRLVAPLSEDFWLRVYNENHAASFFATQWWKDDAGFARVWLNGVLVIDRSEGSPTGGAFESAPIRLEAGRSYDLKVEYVSPGVPKPEFSLSWASNTREWERIPTAYFHADTSSAGPVVRIAPGKTDEKSATLDFCLNAPLGQPLFVRYRVTGTDYVPRAAQVTIAAGAISAATNVTRETGPVQIALEPDVAYRGDGTAGVMVAGVHPLPKGLAAYYPMNEIRGNVVHDCIGSRDASFEVFTMPPQPRWLPSGGKIAGAMEFAEPGIQVQLPGSKIVGDFTAAFWFRTKKANAPLAQSSFELWLEDGRPRLIFGGWHLDLQKVPRLDDGEWHHLVFAWDQSGGKRAMFLYVDGVEAGTGTGPAEAGIDRVALGLSNSYKPGSDGPGFVGAFDDLSIYDRRITAEEIATLAHPGRP